jgi:hypothetical protein
MIDAREFANRQIELNGEFGKFLFEHPDLLDELPDGAHVFFEVAGEEEFNAYSRQAAEKSREKGQPVVRVRVKGLVPPQGSRLIDPVIEPLAEVA